ncbi:hypothetical protein C1752_04427 [Acaryochloris thomasi RCC1774]|uniref:Uncharacterized protein n=1 Tax=Acaryochloris thomasi RCC1774 TaxID=1764569 RepID=A0A2W1JNX6_9CYAN|nr:hypothetical protein C1752_04427 [Acaryochloris thomasi RCC1774]
MKGCELLTYFYSSLIRPLLSQRLKIKPSSDMGHSFTLNNAAQ